MNESNASKKAKPESSVEHEMPLMSHLLELRNRLLKIV